MLIGSAAVELESKQMGIIVNLLTPLNQN